MNFVNFVGCNRICGRLEHFWLTKSEYGLTGENVQVLAEWLLSQCRPLVFRLHNQLGVSVLFTWGVISENNSNHIAIVPGGWNEDYLQTSETYVKVGLFIVTLETKRFNLS